jgi:hypothetical protein
MNENPISLELWLPSLKKYIFKNIEGMMSMNGFSFNRSDFSFFRKDGKSSTDFFFLFVNQFPVNYRVSFLLQFLNHDIKTIKEAFPLKSTIADYKLRALVFFMSDLISLSKKKDAGTETVPDFVLITNNDLFNAADAIIKLLQDDAFPLCEQLSTIEGLDLFFEKHTGWSVNSLNPNNITSEMIAARLAGRRDYKEVYHLIAEDINKKILAFEMDQDTKDVIDKFNDFLLRNY